MGELTLWEKVKVIISNIAWRVFLWARDYTNEEYLDAVYEQEKYARNEQD